LYSRARSFEWMNPKQDQFLSAALATGTKLKTR
jgi:hypothetical protein